MFRLADLLSRLARPSSHRTAKSGIRNLQSPIRSRRLFLESLEDRRVLSTFTVINTDDSGAGSLRQAIVDANDNSGHDTIAFNIPGPGVHTIEPLTNLPFTSDVTIDGTTQPGFVAGGPRLIELSGVNYEDATFPFRDYGLNIGSNSTVQGLAINRFWHGIFVDNNGYHNQIRIAGNYIGTDPTGSFALPNYIGVSLVGYDNLVGTNGDGVNDAAERNIISGNTFQGVALGGDNNVVAGNYIGTDAAGMLPLGQFWGVGGGGYGGKIVGNLISGNDSGINASGYDVQVQGNLIGTDKTGEAALPNDIGIFLQFSHGLVLIGGTTPEARNIITGNVAGIVFYVDGVIQGNYIGRTPSGADIGNSYGIYQWSGSTGIGGRLPGEGNVIAGNGVGINKEKNSPAGVDHIEGNLIVHNGWGISLVDGTSDQVIGGTAAGAGNTIAYNGQGVVIKRHYEPDPAHPFGLRNRIVGNSIFGNQGLGINLSPGVPGAEIDGVTPNDPLDSDIGANEFQNFPELASASSAVTTRVQGSLHSTPSSTFTIDFYASSTVDPSGYGEGERWLGSASVTTDADGNAPFNVVIAAASSAGEFITGTATDAVGNTSEFSQAVQSVPGVKTVNIDIRPESLNADSNGTLTVVIFGAVDFDAAQVDVSSVHFAGAGVWQSTLVDSNGDGRLDLQLKFRTQDTILEQIYADLLRDDADADGILDSTRQTARVEVTGQTLDDELFSGSDDINLFLAGRSLRNLLDELFG